MGYCFNKHLSEKGGTSLQEGNIANCIIYVLTYAYNNMSKDTFKRFFPCNNRDNNFTMFAFIQIVLGHFAGAVTNTLAYRLKYIRTVIGADFEKDKYKRTYTPQFSSLVEYTFFFKFLACADFVYEYWM